MRVLVAGAAGYIASKLVPALLDEGHQVTCGVRTLKAVRPEWRSCNVAVVDPLHPESLPPALESIDVAYYLIHSMAEGESRFAERDRLAAWTFAHAAKKAGVKRIIYLGALGSAGGRLSAHLRSRHDTGIVLRTFGPPLTEFRSAIVVGSGSTSFEIIRQLTERLPVMVCPRWVTTRIQPIAVRDVIRYLVAALRCPCSVGATIEIGGDSVETYRSMMLKYAEMRGLKRRLLRVPVLTPRLSSYWLDLVTSISTSITRPLIEGLRSEVVCTNDSASEIFPGIAPMSYAAALAEALDRPEIGNVSRFSPDAGIRLPGRTFRRFVESEGMYVDLRERGVAASPEEVFRVVEGIGGERGWFHGDLLWRVRGAIDQMLGGQGMGIGRRHPDHLEVGDPLDFWDVEDRQPGRLLRLHARMKLPGRAWLQFETLPTAFGRACFRCTAIFEPHGLAGLLYWWALYPIHAWIFRGISRRIAALAEERSNAFGWPSGDRELTSSD